MERQHFRHTRSARRWRRVAMAATVGLVVALGWFAVLALHAGARDTVDGVAQAAWLGLLLQVRRVPPLERL